MMVPPPVAHLDTFSVAIPPVGSLKKLEP